MLNRNILIKATVLTVAVIIIAHLIVGYLISEAFESHKDSTELVGERVEFKGDTLIILSYDIWSDNYTLENNLEVGRELVNKKIIRDD